MHLSTIGFVHKLWNNKAKHYPNDSVEQQKVRGTLVTKQNQGSVHLRTDEPKEIVETTYTENPRGLMDKEGNYFPSTESELKVFAETLNDPNCSDLTGDDYQVIKYRKGTEQPVVQNVDEFRKNPYEGLVD